MADMKVIAGSRDAGAGDKPRGVHQSSTAPPSALIESGVV